MYGRNGQSICLLSPFFCPSSKIAQPKYAKGASERARSASVYGTSLTGLLKFSKNVSNIESIFKKFRISKKIVVMVDEVYVRFD